MRKRERLDASAPTAAISLDFQAQAITIYNPTPNLVAVRIGSTAIPSGVASADVWLGPYLAQTYPVDGASFGLALVGRGAALEFDTALPGAVLVTFTRDEPPPTYSTIDLSELATQERQLYNHPAEAAISGSTIITPGGSTRTIELVIAAGTSTLTRVALTGVQSGIAYFDSFAPFVNFGKLLAPFYAALDTTLQLSWFSSVPVGNAFKVIGHIGVYRGAYDLDGPERVKAFLTDETDTLISAANPLDVTGVVSVFGTVAATQSGAWSVAAVAPAAGVVLLPAAVRAATPTTPTARYQGAWPGLAIYLDVFAAPGAQTLTLQVLTTNPVGQQPIAYQAAAIGAGGNYAWQLRPGLLAGALANFTQVNVALPGSYAIRVVHSGAGNWTYALSYDVLP